MTKFEVRENGTKKLMGVYSSRNMAVRKMDKLDNVYGSYHYHIVEVTIV